MFNEHNILIIVVQISVDKINLNRSNNTIRPSRTRCLGPHIMIKMKNKIKIKLTFLIPKFEGTNNIHRSFHNFSKIKRI